MIESNNKKQVTAIIYATLFAIAMAFLESAVVVYLRALYYPAGFSFPLQPIDNLLLLTEIGREAATMVMLISVALMLGRRPMERFAWFIFCFAVWDIFYYVFLKLILGWPESLFTMDILFLIPFTWTGPVLAPVVNSICMILLAIIILRISRIKGGVKTGWTFWVMVVTGSVIVITAYTEEYVSFMLNEFSFRQLFNLARADAMQEYALTFTPADFKWWIYLIGVSMHLAGMILLLKKNGFCGSQQQD